MAEFGTGWKDIPTGCSTLARPIFHSTLLVSSAFELLDSSLLFTTHLCLFIFSYLLMYVLISAPHRNLHRTASALASTLQPVSCSLLERLRRAVSLFGYAKLAIRCTVQLFIGLEFDYGALCFDGVLGNLMLGYTMGHRSFLHNPHRFIISGDVRVAHHRRYHQVLRYTPGRHCLPYM